MLFKFKETIVIDQPPSPKKDYINIYAFEGTPHRIVWEATAGDALSNEGGDKWATPM